MRIGVPTPERGWKMDWSGVPAAPQRPKEQLHPVALRTNADVQREHETRISAHSARIENDLRAGKKRRSFRGRRCPIVCLTMTDLATGGNPIFISATAAARSVGRYCDNVIQSIKRNGTCGGHRFQYLDELQGETIDTPAGGRVFVSRKAPTTTQASPGLPGEGLFLSRKPIKLPAIASAHRWNSLPRLAHIPRAVHDCAGQMYLFAS